MPDFPKLEEELVKWWYEQGLITKYLNRNKDSGKTFSFIDGPITANGSMGVHHARGRTLKDVFQRYKNAGGFEQRFQNGFDCQGLWVEVEVEKENGFNSKKDIVDYGLEKFTESCLARVDKFSQIQIEQSKRLGMFMDWDNSYYTNSQNNNLYIWHFLKKVYEKGWLVKNKSATTWCPRCETGLSQHEEADGYKEVSDESVYLKFKLSDSENEYVLAWTTTPWTLSANVMLAINSKFEYVKAKVEGEVLYLARVAADRLGIKDYETIEAKSLIGKKYQSVYDIPAQKNVHHTIVEWEMVDPKEGSGVVHIAPGCGQEDYELGKKLKTEMIAPLDERGYFMEGFGELSGLYAHKVNQLVFDYLEKNNLLFKKETISHRYPHCWRCGTKCLFRLEDSWYIKSEEIRPLLKEAAKTVDWHPKYIGRRMQNWLDSMEDWMISRKRFYGLALPFYECSCGKLTVIGSLEELRERAVNPEKIDKLPSLHRPWIDEIEISCPKCKKAVKRVADVGDCWLDAGVVPFSTLKYLEDKKYWEKWFPADLVLEMTEQVRLWFYSMLFFSVTFENTSPYKNVVVHAEVRDEKGQKMSKTKKNGVPYDEAVAKMGADAMRWLYCQQKSATNVSFGYNIADQVKRGFILILWNSYRFFCQHANLENWQPDKTDSVLNRDNIMDAWLLSRLNSVILKTSESLEKFNTATATKIIENFVNDLSTWYIRRSRDRSDNNEILFFCFDKLAVLLSPFVPFLAEIIYQNLHGAEESVHLQNWPKADEKLIEPELEKEMEVVRNICQLIHGQRQKAGIKLRQALAKVTIDSRVKLRAELVELMAEETNIKKIEFVAENDDLTIELETELSPELVAEGEYRDLVRSIQVLRREADLKIEDKIKIFCPSWPTTFEDEILKKTLGVSIEKSNELKIEKAER